MQEMPDDGLRVQQSKRCIINNQDESSPEEEDDDDWWKFHVFIFVNFQLVNFKKCEKWAGPNQEGLSP